MHRPVTAETVLTPPALLCPDARNVRQSEQGVTARPRQKLGGPPASFFVARPNERRPVSACQRGDRAAQLVEFSQASHESDHSRARLPAHTAQQKSRPSNCETRAALKEYVHEALPHLRGEHATPTTAHQSSDRA